VGDELDPAFDVGHVVGGGFGVGLELWLYAPACVVFVSRFVICSDYARLRGGWARVVELRKLSRWWLVANVDSARGRDASRGADS
jgi:hypothetical protein